MGSIRFKTGFSLLELLIVVVIASVLIGLSVPRLIRTSENGKFEQARTNLNLVRAGEKDYYLKNNTYSSDIDSLSIDNPNNSTTRYFDYTIESASATNFTARAQRKSSAPSPYDTYYYEISKDGRITSPTSPFI